MEQICGGDLKPESAGAIVGKTAAQRQNGIRRSQKIVENIDPVAEQVCSQAQGMILPDDAARAWRGKTAAPVTATSRSSRCA